MNKYSIILSIIVLFTLGSCNQNKNIDKEELNYSNLLFEQKYIDFGTVSGDTVLTAIYNFKNTSEHTLIIDYVNPDCTCTDYYLSNDTIPSGESAFIELYFDTTDKYNEQKIHAVVCANTSTKFYKLTLLAIINR